MKKHVVGLAFAAISGYALAQQGGIAEVKISPNPVKAGQEAMLTISAGADAPGFCGMVVHFDDGSESRNVKVDGNQTKFPVSFSRTFAKPGTYSIKAEGRKITTHLPCPGSATTKLVVEAAAAPAPAAKPAAATAAKPAAATACPDGYKMIGKAGKAGDFSCKGGKDAKPPATPMTCGAGLEYFSNEKSKQLGCRKPKAARK